MSGRGIEAPPAATALALVAALLSWACQEVGESSIDLLAPEPTEDVSFSADVQPILTQRCAFSNCHASPEAIQGANFEAGNAYSNLVGAPSVESTFLAPDNILNRVEPGSPDRSYMFLKITGCTAEGCFLDRMPPPPGQSPLGDAEIAVIRQWIEDGAPDN